VLFLHIKSQLAAYLKFGGSFVKVKIIIGALALLLSGVSGLIINDLSRMEPETLILCSLDEGGVLIPAKICEYYLFNHRDTALDIKNLSSGSGLSFILEGKSAIKKYKIADFFIKNGLSVDSVNHSGGYNLTALHGAVLDNDIKMLTFLLNNNASTNIKAPVINMTPVELAQSLKIKEPNVNREKIIEILSDI